VARTAAAAIRAGVIDAERPRASARTSVPPSAAYATTCAPLSDRPPGGAPGDCVDLGSGVGRAGQHSLGVCVERPPGLGEPYAAGPTLEQRRPELPLEGRYLLRDGGGRERELLCRRREAATAGHLLEQCETPQVEH